MCVELKQCTDLSGLHVLCGHFLLTPGVGLLPVWSGYQMETPLHGGRVSTWLACSAERTQEGQRTEAEIGWPGVNCRKCSETRTPHILVAETKVNTQ